MSVTLSNHLDFENSRRAMNLPAPQAANDAARKVDLDSAVEGMAWKDSCRVAAQGNLNLASPGAIIDAIVMNLDDRVLVPVQTNQSQNGILIWNGAAVPMTRALDANTAAELEQAIVTIEEGTSAGTTYRQTAVNFTLDTNPVIWVTFGTSAPPATTGTAGIASIATQAEVDAGTVPNKFVTPQTLDNWDDRKRKFTVTIGDGSATQFDVTHNFNTQNIFCALRRNGANNEQIIPDLSMPDANTARLNFAIAPAANGFVVTILA